MNWIKIILVALGLFAAAMLLFWLFGVVYTILGYLFWGAMIGGIGYGGYKYLKKDETPKLEEKTPVAISEMQNVDRELEEYKRKYLPK